MSTSLRLYGHSQPQVIYTDNVSDKSFLESSFPSLLLGVTPVDPYNNLPLFSIPQDVHIVECKISLEIQNAVLSLVHALAQSPKEQIAVGFDCEWNVSLRKGESPGKTAIIQLAFNDVINICYVSQFTQNGSLPNFLSAFLSNDSVLKVGRNVTSDLQRLEKETGSKHKFTGAVELAKIAKSRRMVHNAKPGLSELCAVVLGQYLSKNPSIQISEEWENPDLTDQQLQYAAKDAWAALQIYQKLSAIPAAGDVPTDAPPGFSVSIWQDDKACLIAHGEIAPFDRTIPASQVRGCNVTPTRTVVRVTEVLVSGAILTLHQGCALGDLGSPPFDIVCSYSLLETRYISEMHDPVSTTGSNNIQTQGSLMDVHHTTQGDITSASSHSDENAIADVDSEALVEIADAPLPSSEPTSLDAPEVDPHSEKRCEEVMEQFASAELPQYLHSRVLKDIWHLMDMVRVPRAHGLQTAFARALRDAILIPDKDDRQKLSHHLACIGLSWDYMLHHNPKWLWKRCKRVIPPPNELMSLVKEVYSTYGPLKDAKTGVPLFNDVAWEATKNVLKVIQQGLVSDPPGVPLYYAYGTDKDGLTLYRCARGTNSTEGGVHRPIQALMPKSGASPRHAHMALLDFTLKHNLQVGTYNRTGQYFSAHFDIWTINHLQSLIEKARLICGKPVSSHYSLLKVQTRFSINHNDDLWSLLFNLKTSD
ncbi:hypothetical protein FRC03_005638 [Tulasnella sp. 419]|nr:hypothetical protein FRC03_005638 [Tulasnella sp. 419]